MTIQVYVTRLTGQIWHLFILTCILNPIRTGGGGSISTPDSFFPLLKKLPTTPSWKFWILYTFSLRMPLRKCPKNNDIILPGHFFGQPVLNWFGFFALCKKIFIEREKKTSVLWYQNNAGSRGIEDSCTCCLNICMHRYHALIFCVLNKEISDYLRI